MGVISAIHDLAAGSTGQERHDGCHSQEQTCHLPLREPFPHPEGHHQGAHHEAELPFVRRWDLAHGAGDRRVRLGASRSRGGEDHLGGQGVGDARAPALRWAGVADLRWSLLQYLPTAGSHCSVIFSVI